MTRDAAFVRVRGAQLELEGQPYRFAGVNFWAAAYLGRPGRAGDRARLRRELDRLATLGVTNLRLLAGSEPSPHSPLDAAFQPRPREYNEELLQGLDFVLAELGSRGMRAVLFLTNQWEWSGGMATYVEWTTGEKRPPATAWPDTLRFDCRFYELPEARALFRDYVRHVVTRRNTVHGLRYADDPAIMSWQLANEPRAGDAGDLPRFGPPLRDWAVDTARLLRDLAPRQLISTGSEGIVASDFDHAFYRDLHAQPEFDYLTIHLWPFNWHWYRPTDPATLPPSLARAREYVDQHHAIARELAKPLVIEEFGLPRDGGAFTPRATTRARDELVRLVGTELERAHAESAPLCGYNLWSWSGEAVPVDPQGARWRPGEPFGGDNPVEPQGVNSVYHSDHGTMHALAAANRTLRASRALAPV